jgi:large subunit ribosomal protein L1
MHIHGKKYRKAVEACGEKVVLSAKEALDKVKALSYVSFDESVDVDVVLGIDASKGEQVVRGAVSLPHGTGKKVKIAVFAKGDAADQAKAAGADYVGDEDLIEKVSKGWVDFDYAVATPDMMVAVGKLARVLGPRGLLPNKKVGTVTTDVAGTVKDLKGGKAFFKNDKYGLVHFSFGRVSFDVEKLQENLAAFCKVLQASKPTSSKGKFIKKVSISSSMGVGLLVDIDTIA